MCHKEETLNIDKPQFGTGDYNDKGFITADMLNNLHD